MTVASVSIAICAFALFACAGALLFGNLLALDAIIVIIMAAFALRGSVFACMTNIVMYKQQEKERRLRRKKNTKGSGTAHLLQRRGGSTKRILGQKVSRYLPRRGSISTRMHISRNSIQNDLFKDLQQSDPRSAALAPWVVELESIERMKKPFAKGSMGAVVGSLWRAPISMKATYRTH